MEAAFIPLTKVPLFAAVGVEYSEVIALILVIPANIDVTLLLMEAHATPGSFTEVADISLTLACQLTKAMLAAVQKGSLIGFASLPPQINALNVRTS